MFKRKAFILEIVSLFIQFHLGWLRDHPSNCSTRSILPDGSVYHIACSIQSTPCPLRTKKTVAKPIIKNANWYLYSDNKYDKIALNFSWSPSDDSSIEYLEGFGFTLYSRYVTSRETFFCIHQNLSYAHHTNGIFYYDTFGSSLSGWKILPHLYDSVTYTIVIRSLPLPWDDHPDKKSAFHIVIPSCKNELRLKNVFECRQLADFRLSVGNISCEKHSAEFFYNIPTFFGLHPVALLSPITTDNCTMNYTKPFHIKPGEGNFTVRLPGKHCLRHQYTVEIYGQMVTRHIVNFNFTICSYEQDHSSTVSIWKFISVPCLVVLVAAIMLGVYFRKKPRKYCIFQKTEECKLLSIDNGPEQNLREKLSKITEKGKNCTVFIIFVNDHPKHEKVVLDFANFLHGDLNFEVITELFQTEQIYADPVTWMEESLQKADKVIVIWSPSAARKWELYNSMESVEQDLFTPILKRIKKDIFRDKNVAKYYFGYFEYCSKEDIPVIFRETSVFHFNLMKQFEELYFRLKDIERYMPGAVIRKEEIAFDRYFDPSLNKYGPGLETSICEMCVYVKENPNWQSEQSHARWKDSDMCCVPPNDVCEAVNVTHLKMLPLNTVESQPVGSVQPCSNAKYFSSVLSKRLPKSSAISEVDNGLTIDIPEITVEHRRSVNLLSMSHCESHIQTVHTSVQSPFSEEICGRVNPLFQSKNREVREPLASHSSGDDMSPISNHWLHEHADLKKTMPNNSSSHLDSGFSTCMSNELIYDEQQLSEFPCTPEVDCFDFSSYDRDCCIFNLPVNNDLEVSDSFPSKNSPCAIKLAALDMDADAMAILTGMNKFTNKLQ